MWSFFKLKTVLQEIDISNNDISDEGGKIILSSLGKNRTIREIKGLESNNIGTGYIHLIKKHLSLIQLLL